MAYPLLLAALLTLLVAAILQLLYRHYRYYSTYNLPPGHLGIPIIGRTFSLLRAFSTNSDDQWFRDRINKYGPVSMLTLLGSPTVLLAGPAANRFIFSNDGLILTQTSALRALVGRSVLTLAGVELKQVRGALQGFLKPEMVRRYVCKIDHEVRSHVELNWVGRDIVTVLPTVRRLALGIICSAVLGQEAAHFKESLCTDFVTLGKAILSFPVKIPFSRFSKGMTASAKIRKAITNIAQKKQESLLHAGHGAAGNDFITYMLILCSQGVHSLTMEDIVDNAMSLIVGAHETSSVLITFMIRYLAEQDEIASNKKPEDALTWDDVAKMKYTWKVAMETLRTVPPVFGSFRTATKDIEYQGYHIPKGWKVFAAQSVTHMDAQIFHEPHNFDPTRFEKFVPPYCYMPFGGGPRMCPGNEFARVEIMVAMHYLVRQFRWKIMCKEETYKRDPKPTPSLGLPIKLNIRSMP
ncbi:cytochrome P450 716B1 isoform X2 [Brachypodium distachyon]|uniref:cytochrome P450 716B1 isoform X2 n=1 Tax=Brachypodium distachyon TaxID=15368 RepID=UPI0001C70DBF|nr:cytochrome P450 716B1 isoform X2 [Brachypodium distachyon]|eukprot:XP_024318460.1 cytochrome P450 716B1 isoform X2 [Brachypodium distachyon]